MATIPIPKFRNVAASRTELAVLGVEFETAAFERALQEYLLKVPQNIVTVVKTLAFDLEKDIKERTPVDTGRLRSSFHTVLPGEKDSYRYKAKTKDGKTATFDGALSENPAPLSNDVIEALVGTNVEYALAIEAGHSRQRPEGMVRVSIAKQRGKLEAAVQRVLAGEKVRQ